MRSVFVLGLGLFTLPLLSGCERVDYIELKPADLELKTRSQEQFIEAHCMARTGVRAVQARVSWSVKDPSIASVDGKGLVRPVASGETEVIARNGDVEARLPVRVLLVERIAAEPPVLVLKEGDEAQTFAVKTWGKGDRLFTDRVASLTSHALGVARVVPNPHGPGSALLPLDPGEATIDVQVDGIKTSVQVRVEKDTAKKK